MADPVIGAASQVTLERALSLASDRIGLLVGFKKDVASMTDSLGFIKDVLADAEEWQNQSRTVQRWLNSLEEVAYDADNVLDELHYESLRHQVESRNRHKHKVCRFFSFSNINLAFRWRMASKVRDIKIKLNKINQQARDFGLDSRLVRTAAVGDTGSRQTDSVFVPMVGRADDESNIVNILLKPSEKVVSVLPIIGMGGLGKTTLAKSIYNKQQIDGQFERVIERCDGLPLAAIVIGGLLSLKKKEEWRLILENRLLSLSAGGDHVMQILKFSFDNLPSPAVKKCFAYCSIFPQDTEMEGDMLIELWMAEGFLHAGLENKTMEEIGEDYLEILLQSSLFEEIRYGGRRRRYKMHDMVHEVSKLIMSKSTKFINSETGLGDNSNQVRCLVIDSFGEGAKNLLESRSNLLHTLFLSQGSLSDDMLKKLKNLHVLNLSGEENQNLPISIGKLRHLRYINFEDSRSATLPESVCKLYNLQTLRLQSLILQVLPKGMCDLISLRHLHYYNNDEEFQMPLEMGRLTCLQTLEFFKVGREKGRQIGELGSLKNLKGKLRIRNLELVKGKEGAEEAKLSEKANLFRLELQWAYNREGDNYNDEDVLDGLRPHPNLEELAICNFMGDQFPRWLMDLPTTLPKLARLAFKQCNRCRELPPLQNFTSLKELEIDECDGLTNLPGGMLHSCTSLQKLRVAYCDNLISFPLNLRQTPSLLELRLYYCPKLKTSTTPKGFGFLTSLRKLRIGPFSDGGDDHENSSIYNEFDWSGLISSSSSSSSSALDLLFLYGLPHMESLPPQIQYLTTLTSLALVEFGGIKALPDWFGNFAALEELQLLDLKELRHLPSEDVMRSLTKLKRLRVGGSPLLKERCTPESSGPDSQWSKVSHIQHLHIS
ncbi:unnamed protein product [Coffea canephora]|uniref:DH200=94 genomic scaffold, scaffold_570 n=1 Tax=Coffea canephora TaxID=49390 RepID=A0A068VGB9_COFCA|nr:unnamed protein product [Coffea canephora]